MAGGNWTAQNKTRAGVYTNTRTTGGSQQADNVRGVVALPLALDFGPKEIKVVDAMTNLDGYATDLGSQLLLRETLKRAGTVLLGRVSGGVKAATTEGTLTAEATWEGAAGNDINVVVAAIPDEVGSFLVTTYLKSVAKDVQTAKTIAELENNTLVKFSGTGALTAGTHVLSGGSTTEPTANDYAEFFEKVQFQTFNVLALPVEDESIKIAGVNFIKRLRSDEGKKVQVVVADYPADNYGVISVKNGVILTDGTVIDATKAVAWVAGATAGAGLTDSLTYTAYDGAVGVDVRYLHDEIVAAIKNGEFLFTEYKERAVVELDINSYVSFTPSEGEAFRKNRLLRVIDTYDNNTRETFADFFIGNVDRDAAGADLLKGNRVSYLNGLQEMGAIDEFVPEDVVVTFGDESNSFVVETFTKPIDSLEKVYHTQTVR